MASVNKSAKIELTLNDKSFAKEIEIPVLNNAGKRQDIIINEVPFLQVENKLRIKFLKAGFSFYSINLSH